MVAEPADGVRVHLQVDEVSVVVWDDDASGPATVVTRQVVVRVVAVVLARPGENRTLQFHYNVEDEAIIFVYTR